MPLLILYLWVALLGLCLGSFLNVVIARVPKGTFFGNKRSYCPACGETLRWTDLIPVFSYLWLRGRCRTCSARISARYPLVELSGAALGVLCLRRYDVSLQAGAAFGIMLILLAVALIDFDTMEIPDALTLALVPFAIAAVWLWPEIGVMARVIGFFSISVPLLLIALVINGAFGGGDIKLMAVCGFLLGWQNVLLAFFIALLTGGIVSIYLLAAGKAKRGAKIAFGPHLCLGVAVSLLAGAEIIGLYLGLFLGL